MYLKNRYIIFIDHDKYRIDTSCLKKILNIEVHFVENLNIIFFTSIVCPAPYHLHKFVIKQKFKTVELQLASSSQSTRAGCELKFNCSKKLKN